MFELSVQREFCAAHAITINGRREPTHGHNWRVTAVVRGDELDRNGLLCDFHVLQRLLDQVIAPFNDADLNRTGPFDRTNPTAESVVQHIALALAPLLPTGVKLSSVKVTEAPGCAATYRIDQA